MYYYTPPGLQPLLRISLEDFVVQYQESARLNYELTWFSCMCIGYFDNDFIQDFVEHYAQTILPTQEFEFHIDPEDGNCHLSFPYQLEGQQLNIQLPTFHFTDRFNLATPEDVFNLICDFQLEVQRVRYNLKFK